MVSKTENSIANGLTKPSCGRPFFIINEDNDHYFKLSSEFMTRECLESYVDNIARGGHVTHVFFCPCGQRTSYDSKVWEPIWYGMDQPDFEGKTHNIWCVNAKKLYDAGLDPYAIWLKRCRERGMSPWLSVRMNDVHNVNIPGYFRLTTHWSNHPELWRNPEAKPPCAWMECSYDYSKPEVQDYHLAIVKELLERYDPDGIELDWMRFGRHLTPGREFEQANCLTEFIRRVRVYADEAAERLGHDVFIGVRVPTQMEVARECGMDCEAWAREKLVDLVVPSNFFATSDYDIDLETWQSRLQALHPGLVVLPSMGERISSSADIMNIPADMDYYRGWADMMYSRKAQGLYFFNAPYLARHDELYADEMSPESLRECRRRYPVTWHDYSPLLPGYDIDHVRQDIQLPVDASAGAMLHVLAGNVAGIKTASVILGFDTAVTDALHGMTVSVNGSLAGKGSSVETSASLYGGQEQCRFAVKFEIPPEVLRKGWNAVEMGPLSISEQARLVWCEILVE